MPDDTVWPTPNGLPMASTRSPTATASESAKSSAGRRVGGRRGGSPRGRPASSASTSVPSYSRRSERTTRMSVAFSTTWKFDTTSPSPTITPEPSEFCSRGRGVAKSPKNCEKNGSSKNGLARSATMAGGVDVDHRRRGAFDHRREAELDLGAPNPARGSRRGRWRAAGQAPGQGFGQCGSWSPPVCHRIWRFLPPVQAARGRFGRFPADRARDERPAANAGA